MKAPLKVAVFASGSGSNFQRIADLAVSGKLNIELSLLVCDKPGAYVIERAERAGVPVFAFRPKEYPDRRAYEREIVEELKKRGVELIVLAGYMRLLTDELVAPFYGRMINIHPSLLPAFPGTKGVADALAYGVKVTGCTVHFVDNGMDTGPIIAQQAVAVEEGDTVETLAARIHQAEHELYPKVIDWISRGMVALADRKVSIQA